MKIYASKKLGSSGSLRYPIKQMGDYRQYWSLMEHIRKVKERISKLR